MAKLNWRARVHRRVHSTDPQDAVHRNERKKIPLSGLKHKKAIGNHVRIVHGYQET